MTSTRLTHASFPLLLGLTVMALSGETVLHSHLLKAFVRTTACCADPVAPADATLTFDVPEVESQGIRAIQFSGPATPVNSYSVSPASAGGGLTVHFADGVCSISPVLWISWATASAEHQTRQIRVEDLKPGEDRHVTVRL